MVGKGKWQATITVLVTWAVMVMYAENTCVWQR